jgi:hypothetical protein
MQEASIKFTFIWVRNSSLLTLKRTNATVGIHTDFPLSAVDKNEQLSSYSKKPGQVIVLGTLASDRKNCPIISATDGERILAYALPGAATPECVALALCYTVGDKKVMFLKNRVSFLISQIFCKSYKMRSDLQYSAT